MKGRTALFVGMWRSKSGRKIDCQSWAMKIDNFWSGTLVLLPELHMITSVVAMQQTHPDAFMEIAKYLSILHLSAAFPTVSTSNLTN